MKHTCWKDAIEKNDCSDIKSEALDWAADNMGDENKLIHSEEHIEM